MSPSRTWIAAYEHQCAAIEKLGGSIVLMASRALAACAKSPDDYARVYDRVLSQVKDPVTFTGSETCSTPRCGLLGPRRVYVPRWTCVRT